MAADNTDVWPPLPQHLLPLLPPHPLRQRLLDILHSMSAGDNRIHMSAHAPLRYQQAL
jgi:hypothetical protein